MENIHHGRRRHIWVSVSNDLKRDAERDLRDLNGGSDEGRVEVLDLHKV